ncbi:MAG TPA: crosslink repair DNA glycosylase YcaQ family protein [Polyangia bacterium]|nr:crosslink repair DNA glycosylase YcaQ family protein [Polyangia bacterium]
MGALFLARQHLDRPRARRLSQRSLIRLASDTGGIQIDSINVLDRAHYLTAWSRFGAYDRAAFDRLVYERRVLFEYWAHAACLVPATHFPWWRRAMLDYSLRARGWGRWLRSNRPLIAKLEAAIAAGGPMGSMDFPHEGKRSAGGWWNWKPATFALDHLWMSGRTLIHSRVNFQKRFDLAERVMAASIGLDTPSASEFRRWHVKQSLHAMGAATASDLRMYLTFPRASVVEQRRAISDLLETGEVVEIAVSGGGAEAAGARGATGTTAANSRWFALARDLPALSRAASQRAPSRGTTLLAPFDSFLWHRQRTARLYGFDYRIEVYTPAPRRVYGYYVLPILHDGQLIGRLDAKVHRATRLLEVRSLHFEPWFRRAKPAPPVVRWGPIDREGALAGLTDTLWSLAAFLGADRVTVERVAPAGWRAPIARALRRGPVS